MGKVRSVRWLALAVGTLLGSSGLATAAAMAEVQPAGASTISATLPYSCTVANLVTATLAFTVSATAPATVPPGGTVSLSGVQLSSAIPAKIVTEIVKLLHILSFSGTLSTLDFTATGATPASINGAGAGLAFTIPFKSGQAAPFTVPASPETVGPFKAGQSGSVVVSPGAIQIDARVAGLSYSLVCAPPSSIPAAAQATIAIVPPPTTTSSTVATSTSVPTSTVPTSSVPPTTTPSTVPVTKTGEPWSGWPYWLLVALLAAGGGVSLERAFRLRRRRT